MSSELEIEGIHLAQQAVKFDQEAKYDAAIYYYSQASSTLLEAVEAGSTHPNLQTKAKEYADRAIVLKETLWRGNVVVNIKTQHQCDFERAQFLLLQAFEQDEEGDEDEAAELYMQAAEICISIKNSTHDKDLELKLTKLTEQALDRAEAIKKVAASEPELVLPTPPGYEDKPAASSDPKRSPMVRRIPPLGFGNLNIDDSRQSSRPSSYTSGAALNKKKQNLLVAGSASYTKEEIAVLRATSVINGREYVPFMDVDLKERFGFPLPFSDKDGKLILSPKQKSRIAKWARPEEFISGEPTMILKIDPLTIKQTCVSDCSFVASLAISALYEKTYKKSLITSIIYPQNKNGIPIYNPCGKYMVKLHINGVPRKVIIDDTLPLSKEGELLCSFSINRHELWISLLEKAYMKVMGGYNFPGSNSSVDLHALIGWIPERVGISEADKTFNKDKLFRKILDRFHKGDVLITFATGPLSEIEADRAGLVTTHAYAMLDVREVKGYRLIQLKNPWSHLRWKGNFSERDERHWTPDIQKALSYDPKSAQQFDDGVFWIDYDSICRFFEVAYLNWNPQLFKHTTCTHSVWNAGTGPVKDTYNIGDNPQYMLNVFGPGGVWMLLTRHITDKDDFAENREFIALVIYNNTEGKRVFYPYDPPPYIDGVRINSPHYLCKMVVQQAGNSMYTVVVSEYEKLTTIRYTLRVFATCEFIFKRIRENWKLKKTIDGHWTSRTAGGCANHPSYKNNPIYQLTLQERGEEEDLVIIIKGPKQYSVGFDITTVSSDFPNSKGNFTRKSSGAFRSGFAVLELDDVPSGVYNITPCTFRPGQEGPFLLTIQASCNFKVGLLQ